MASDTGGVKPIPIGGRMVRERERLIGMTNEERAWRRVYLKDFEVGAPRKVPQLELELTNPIRRFYKWPLDKLGNALTPIMGAERAYSVRFWTGKFLLATAAIYAGAYYVKYNANDWTRKGGWRIIKSRKIVNPGDPGYPKVSERTKPSDYSDRGFKDAKI